MAGEENGELHPQTRKFLKRLHKGAELRGEINQDMPPAEAGEDSVGEATRKMARSSGGIVEGK